METQCYMCERYQTTDSSNMRRHQLSCMKRLYCKNCKFSTIHKMLMESHMKVHLPVHKKIYSCKKCKSYETNLIFNFKRHATTCGSKLECALCDFKANKKSHLIVHMNRKHKMDPGTQYICNFCKVYKTKRINNFNCHITKCKPKFKCEHCDFMTPDQEKLKLHLRAENHTSILCSTCGKVYINKYYYNQHLSSCSGSINSLDSDSVHVKVAIKGLFKKITFTNFKLKNDFKKTLYIEMKDIIAHHIQSEANIQNGIKWSLAVQVSLYKLIDDGQSWADPVFHSKSQISLPYEEENHLEEIFERLNEKLELYCSLGSGWTLQEVTKIDVNIAQYNPLSGSSWLPTPKKFNRKKNALLNIKNTSDEYCFKYCVLASVFNLRSESPSDYSTYENELDFTGLDFPTKVQQVEKFERQNKNISISIFGYENHTLFPLRISASSDRNHHIDLLLITKQELSHYLLILDKNKFFKYILYPKLHHGVYICDYCLNKVKTKSAFENHVAKCKLISPQATKYPTPGKNILKWESYHKKMKRPITIYADFETMNIEGKFVASSYAYLIVDDTHTPIKLCNYRSNNNVVHHFLSSLLNDVEELKRSRKDHMVIVWTDEDKIRYQEATHCHICEEPFDTTITDTNHPMSRVADHCHFEFPHTKPTPYNIPGRLRGAAHRQCNAGYHDKFRATVVFHNLKRFDGHLIIKEIAAFISNAKDFRCIARTIEEYPSFSIKNIDFIDSFEFLNESLDSLVTTLGKKDMKILRHYYPDDGHFSLLCRKGVFPYEFVDSYKKLENVRDLPPIEDFFSSLTEKHISNDDYKHALTVWNTFNCRTLGEYQDLYNLCDVILLGDIFENFRTTMLEHYAQDPCQYVSFPALSWNAMLRMTKVQLELITDPDIYLIFEQGIRGGLSVIPTRYAEAVRNEAAILYLDCNNLYGGGLSNFLPLSDFKFVSPDIIDEVLNTLDDAEFGYICEVDMYTPESLHDYMNDYPLAPCKKAVSEDELSLYQKNLLKELKTLHTPSEKLIASLEPKTNYIVHYRNLKLYVELGMKITKVHRIVQFKQAAWMKPYIDFNTAKRAQASSIFASNLHKQATNSVFGRTLMNVRHHRNFTLITDEQRAKSYICKPTFKQFAIFNEDLVGILFNKRVVTLNKPIYAGMVCLEISKLIMYVYYYKVLKPKYNNNMRLCMTDTDSLLLHLKTPDLIEDMKSLINTLDTSNYSLDHPLYSNERKKQVGYFKCETPNDEILSFVGLRAKMYSFETKNNSCDKTVGKGIPRTKLNKLTLLDYKKSLFQECTSSVSFNQISSKNHTLELKKQTKIALSPMDDKRYLLPDKINSLAYGHYKIKEIENCTKNT